MAWQRAALDCRLCRVGQDKQRSSACRAESAAVRLQEEEPQHAPSLASAHQRRADLILEAAEANIAQFEQV